MKVRSIQNKEKAQRVSCCANHLIHGLRGSSFQEAERSEGCRQAAGLEERNGMWWGKGQAEAQQCRAVLPFQGMQRTRVTGAQWSGGRRGQEQALGLKYQYTGREKAKDKRMKTGPFPSQHRQITFWHLNWLFFRALSIQNYWFKRMPVGSTVVCGRWMD